MRSRRFVIILVIACTMTTWMGLACSTVPDAPRLGNGGRDDPRYSNWAEVSFQNIRVVYPPDHIHADRMEEHIKGYPGAIIRHCRIFEIPVPTETLTVIYHTGFGQGREWTGREYPFVVDSTIYFWLPSFLGPTIAKYLLPMWCDVEPRYEFLKHGIICLLDESRQSYHEVTKSFLDNDGFIPLTELAVDTTIDHQRERVQSAMAASFVDFILYTYGQPLLKALYVADSPIEKAVPELMNITADSLEAEWVRFVETLTAGEIPARPEDRWTDPRLDGTSATP